MADIGYSEEDVKDWEQLPMISGVITSSYFGAWLYYRDKRRDKRVNSELLDEVAEKIKSKCDYVDTDDYYGYILSEKDIDEVIAEMKAEVSK